ncbi:hypothetical protein [Bacillus mycoides]|uniref:Uncharacterized protein n=2 Tax=Bacillus cereus group TaxID=86661 RepID=A0AA44R848_9BACI|nr:hypothetical protein [Bacillus mycoides]OJD59878.1 hypothetical protein BAU27_14445 [Bacillus sp. NH11B]OJE47732.1 hypothetical protein BAQ49_28260 [Bacillus proteolyticus]PRD06947.1 hypothetical protein CQ058_28200 [Bacillus sp. MYb56]RAN66485.1 hypothetical protein B5P40_30765 [Bacillus sp. SRB_8]KMQ11696.1 hypothetical protein TU70_30780 [Bacillus mycoides]
MERKLNKIIILIESEVGRVEDKVKLLGADGMCGMEFTGNKVNVYNDAGYVMESMTTREHVQEVIDFLEGCKKEMEE